MVQHLKKNSVETKIRETPICYFKKELFSPQLSFDAIKVKGLGYGSRKQCYAQIQELKWTFTSNQMLEMVMIRCSGVGGRVRQ